jgi:signal transduction histidine kinase
VTVTLVIRYNQDELLMNDKEQPTQPQPSLARSQDAWESIDFLWSIIFLGAVILALFFALRDVALTASARQTAVILSVTIMGWHIGWIVYYRRFINIRFHLVGGLVYNSVLIALWFALVQIDEAFYFILFGLISQFYIILTIRWAAIFTVLVLGLMAYMQTIGEGNPFSWQVVLLYAIMAAVGIMIGVWLERIIRQSMERRDLIEQLEATQLELAEAERKAGVLAERQRLAHEIHDTLAQDFISIIMHLDAAEQSVRPEDETVQRHLGQAQAAARSGLRQSRHVVEDLLPEQLAQAILPDAIANVVARWSESSGVPVEFAVTGEVVGLETAVDKTLLRATQEALANVRKHAQASSVTVTLSYLGDQVMLDVQDDGVGMVADGSVSSLAAGGYGLIAMRERITNLNGDLIIESEPGDGTTVVVSIPVSQ